MNQQEGVIKYKLEHCHQPIENQISIADLSAWRTLLYKLELIGENEDRYDGYGFGNISQRINQINTEKTPFIISGTQTGNIKTLSKKHYCTVFEANPEKNSIISAGEVKPSSEALTHANIYHQDQSIQSVIHIHSPDIWHNTKQLNLPYTNADIAYGTPEMAIAVEYLFKSAEFKNTGIFSMLGHEDGVIAFSDSIQKASCLIIQILTKAQVLELIKQQS